MSRNVNEVNVFPLIKQR